MTVIDVTAAVGSAGKCTGGGIIGAPPGGAPSAPPGPPASWRGKKCVILVVGCPVESLELRRVNVASEDIF